MSEPNHAKPKRFCKDCGLPVPRAISRHRCPLVVYPTRPCKRCGEPTPNLNRPYCSWRCYKPEHSFKCENCSKEFRGKPHENPRFCNRICYEAHRQKQIEYTCEQCGARFKRPNCEGRPKRFCSKKCTGNAQKKVVHLNCSYCGKDIIRSPAFAKSKRAFCSSRCFAKAISNSETLTCAHCGSEFSATKYYREKIRIRFCSPVCRRSSVRETSIERDIRLALESLSTVFHQEYPVLHNPKSKRRGNFYFLDFFLPDTNIAIEADGIYWHESRKESDAKRDLFLASKGIKVIRVTDKEIEAAESVTALLSQKLLTN